MKTFKTRHQFYLSDELSDKLDTLTAKPGASKTAVLTDALSAWFERKGSSDLDQRFGPRLDRTARALERTERKVDAVTEMLGLFVQHQLTISAHKPPFDEESGRLGLARYRKYMEIVEHRLAKQTAPTTAAISERAVSESEGEQ